MGSSPLNAFNFWAWLFRTRSSFENILFPYFLLPSLPNPRLPANSSSPFQYAQEGGYFL